MRKRQTRKLYHFTCLFHLPAIIRSGGLTSGHIPTLPVDKDTPVVNLTSIGERHQQHWYHDFPNSFDKTKVRITVDVPAAQLKSWKQIQKDFEIRSKDMKILDPHYQRTKWSYVFDGLGLNCFESIQIWQDGQYSPLGIDDAEDIAAIIQEEISSNFVQQDGQWMMLVGDSSWLFDGHLARNPIPTPELL